jgi:hypothetical protein
MTDMTKRLPITPPQKLLKSWEDRHFDENENVDFLLVEAYQAGAAQMALHLSNEWDAAIQADLENGVRFLNECAAEAFNIRYPSIAAFGDVINAHLPEHY